MRAFSLIEMMICIALVAILSAVTVVSYNEYVDRTYAMMAVNDLRMIETALKGYLMNQEATVWPWENAIPGGSMNGAGIQSVSDHTNSLGGALKNVPIPRFKGATIYGYDNDSWDINGYNPNNCSETYDGVGLTIGGVISVSAFNIIDKAIDGTLSSTCGKVRRASPAETLYYMIGLNYRDF